MPVRKTFKKLFLNWNCKKRKGRIEIESLHSLLYIFTGTEDSVGDLFQMTSSSKNNNCKTMKSLQSGELSLPTSTSVPNCKSTPGRRKKPSLNSRERNVRRIESNERERLRMHGLNEAFQVCTLYTWVSWVVEEFLRGGAKLGGNWHNSRERNVRWIESNERDRLRMHGLK